MDNRTDTLRVSYLQQKPLSLVIYSKSKTGSLFAHERIFYGACFTNWSSLADLYLISDLQNGVNIPSQTRGSFLAIRQVDMPFFPLTRQAGLDAEVKGVKKGLSLQS